MIATLFKKDNHASIRSNTNLIILPEAPSFGVYGFALTLPPLSVSVALVSLAILLIQLFYY